MYNLSRIEKGKEIQLRELTTYTIPSTVTKINDYCFARCKKLTEIKGLEYIKEFGKYWFEEFQKKKRNNLKNGHI